MMMKIKTRNLKREISARPNDKAAISNLSIDVNYCTLFFSYGRARDQLKCMKRENILRTRNWRESFKNFTAINTELSTSFGIHSHAKL